MRRCVLLAAVALLAPACGGNGDGDEGEQTAGTPIRTITIEETDFALDPASVSVDAAGTYAFEAVNKGQSEHALEVEGEGIEEETDTLQPGERATLTVELGGGTYELYCPVDGHADKGMEGEIEVAGDSGGSGY
jgi:uncharacterized cupredoxin-like copper-binding protein